MSTTILLSKVRPEYVYLPIIFPLSLLLSTTVSFIPLVILLSTLLLYVPHLLSNKSSRFIHLLYLWLSLSLGVTIAHILPSLHALSTPITSIIVLFLLSSITAVIALLPVFLHAQSSAHAPSSWSQLTLFPTFWVLIWYL